MNDSLQKHPLIAWFASNAVVANILMASILGFGFFTFLNLRKEAFPTFTAETVDITVPFLGGTPEDVERGVTIKIEEVLIDVNGIDSIESTSTENSATITVEAQEGYPLKTLLDDIKIQVDSISSFPEQAENPIIVENQRRSTVIRVHVHGNVSQTLLKETARGLRDELLQFKGVSFVQTSGDRDYEISIEVSEEKLRFYNLTFSEVSTAITNNSLDLSEGDVLSQQGNISIRSRSQAYVAADFAKIPLRTTSEGTRILVGDVAKIRDAFVDQEILSRFDGEPAIGLQVQTTGEGDIIQAADSIATFIKSYPENNDLPAGITLSSWNDGATPIRSRLKLLSTNGLTGMALVLIVLALFLNLRLAFWVAVGIPISIAGALSLFPADFIDISLNQLTAFAFIVVLGIIVDDAIVVAESIYSEKEDHPDDDHIQTTVRGVSHVIVPAAFGVLTTIAAFYPLTRVSGRLGNVFGQIAIAVILCLTFSLLESKVILPSHLAHIKPGTKPKFFLFKFWYFIQRSISEGLRAFIKFVYQPTLRFLLPFRYATLGLFVAVFVIVVGLVPSGKLRFVFFPDIFRDSISANLELEQGLPVDYLHQQSERIALALHETIAELEEQSGQKLLLHSSVNASSNTASSITAELTTSESRSISTAEVVNAWRKKVKGVPGAKSLLFAGTAGPPGQGVDIKLASKSLEDLQAAAKAMKTQIATYSGVYDISDTFDSGKPEIQVDLTPTGQAQGFDKRSLAENVRFAFFGDEAQRVQRGRDEVKVMVRYPLEDRENLETLRQMRVRNANGTAIPFSMVADTSYGESLASIQRFNFNRIVSVQAEIDKSVTSGEEVLALLDKEYFPAFLAEFPSVKIELDGEAQERKKSLNSLMKGFLVSIILIYILLAIPLKSYVRPLLIMSVIPFGIIGALLGHFIIGIPVSILSVFGILALSGIVVNDSLILSHRINELNKRSPENGFVENLVLAGSQRFRAILLTTLTTFVGLIPLLFEPSVQAQFLKPMAVSVGFGVLFATLITLILLPILFLILQDIRHRFSRSFQTWRELPHIPLD